MNKFERVYFVGIGGIGMAALARYFLANRYDVAGYDRTPSQLTGQLADEGATISYDDSMDAIPVPFRSPHGTLVVYTPAIPNDNIPLAYFRDNGFDIHKRAEVLGIVTRDSKAICFAGTHGKTTTSSMAAHILETSGIGCNAFLGGVLRNYNSNLLLSPSSPFSVVEADEYDRSFHQLTPFIAVITATDPDHLDIYGSKEAYLESFAHFTELIRPGGALIIHEGLELQPRTPHGVITYTYSRSHGDFHAENITYADGSITFDFVTPAGRVNGIDLGVPVDINIDNAVAALAACWLTGRFDPDASRSAMKSFMGAKRRFEFWLREPAGDRGRVIIDDYAHHPDELKASIMSVRKLYPNRNITVAFQPHLFSRTRDLAPEFADALSLADSVVLLDIYPARELPIPGVSSSLIFDLIKTPHKLMISKENLVETLKKLNFEVLLTAGAGDINLQLPSLLKSLGY